MSLKAIQPAPRNPRTPREWQEAADVAWLCLAIDSCRQYGLLEGGPEIDRARCEELLERAQVKGIRPRKRGLP